jgi:hypothetical protein
MNKRSFTLGSIILVISLATLACGITLNLTPEPPTLTPLPTPALVTELPSPTIAQVTEMSQPSDLSLVFNLFEESGVNPPYSIIARIPYLQGSDESGVLLFNQQVYDLLNVDINNFRASVLQDAPNPSFGMGSSYELQYALLSPAGDILSLKFDITMYFDGAAHPNSYSLTFNYDLAVGQQLNLYQIFLPGSDYLGPIAAYCKTQLASREIAYFEGGAEPVLENYRNWNLTTDGLLISFDPYQVAPYAAGPQTVLIPYSELITLIDPAGPLAGIMD